MDSASDISPCVASSPVATGMGGAAVASFSPDLFAGPRGDPLMMVAPEDNGFQAASFNGGAVAEAFEVSADGPAGPVAVTTGAVPS